MSDTSNLTRFGRFVRVFSGEHVPTTVGSLIELLVVISFMFGGGLFFCFVGMLMLHASFVDNSTQAATFLMPSGLAIFLGGLALFIVPLAHNKPIAALLKVLGHAMRALIRPLRFLHKPLLGLGGAIRRGFVRISSIKVGVQHRP